MIREVPVEPPNKVTWVTQTKSRTLETEEDKKIIMFIDFLSQVVIIIVLIITNL
jgi:hypothetical protein